jgi:hypothetical protein
MNDADRLRRVMDIRLELQTLRAKEANLKTELHAVQGHILALKGERSGLFNAITDEDR